MTNKMRTAINDKHSLADYVVMFAQSIMDICNKIEKIYGKVPEIIATIAYIVGHLLMAIVHEPWYDEAVAWQIAKCASFSDILFRIPHNEGHPPLWHLILAPFAKSGMSYELSLSVISLIFAGVAVVLIIWKSPFPRIIRLLLPFTYFYFYQYGVISRPYCVMMLAFVLLAMTYHERDSKPGIHILCLILLCLTSAYGIVIAGGMAIVWVWEIWDYRKIADIISDLRIDRRLWWLLVLLIIALFLIIEIMPNEGTVAITTIKNKDGKNSILSCLIYMVFALPMEVSMTSLYNRVSLLQFAKLDLFLLLSISILGIGLWIFLFSYRNERIGIKTIVVPYVFFAAFCAFIYMSLHHIGIGLFIIIYYLWIVCDNKQFIYEHEKEKNTLFESCRIIVISCAIFVSLMWNVISCFQDVCVTYSAGREEAKFIKEYNLDNYNIMTQWGIEYDDNWNVIKNNVSNGIYAVNLSPYFDNNIFYNFNLGKDEMAYSTHQYLDEKKRNEIMNEWKKTIPDVLYMDPRIDLIYDTDEIKIEDYILVYSRNFEYIWKGATEVFKSEIYLREALLNELGLNEVEHAYPFNK